MPVKEVGTNAQLFVDDDRSYPGRNDRPLCLLGEEARVAASSTAGGQARGQRSSGHSRSACGSRRYQSACNSGRRIGVLVFRDWRYQGRCYNADAHNDLLKASHHDFSWYCNSHLDSNQYFSRNASNI